MFRSVIGGASATSLAFLVASACNPAQAALNYKIFQSAGNLVVETSGSLNLLNPTGSTITCGFDGALALTFNAICTGTDKEMEPYQISGPSSFSAGTAVIFPADSVSGISTALSLDLSIFTIEGSYVSGTPIVSSATFFGKTLADVGLTSFGSLGTWTISDTGDTINVNAVDSSPVGVPGPLPLLGAGAAFGYSRRLRRRLGKTNISRPGSLT